MQMKLYTEEQVKEICKYFDFPIKVINEILKLTPIELPSDEEVENYANETQVMHSHSEIFVEGAKWVIEKIKQQVIP